MITRVYISDTQFEVHSNEREAMPGEESTLPRCEQCKQVRPAHKMDCTDLSRTEDNANRVAAKALRDELEASMREAGVHPDQLPPPKLFKSRVPMWHETRCECGADACNHEQPSKETEMVNPQEPGRVIGYKQNQTPADLALVNFSKELELKVGALIQDLDGRVETTEAEEMVKDAARLFRSAFMLANRSVFMPDNPYGSVLER